MNLIYRDEKHKLNLIVEPELVAIEESDFGFIFVLRYTTGKIFTFKLTLNHKLASIPETIIRINNCWNSWLKREYITEEDMREDIYDALIYNQVIEALEFYNHENFFSFDNSRFIVTLAIQASVKYKRNILEENHIKIPKANTINIKVCNNSFELYEDSIPELLIPPKWLIRDIYEGKYDDLCTVNFI